MCRMDSMPRPIPLCGGLAQAVQKLSQSIHAELRRELGYKRLDFDFREEDGYISLMTPGFDLEIRIDQCPDDPKAYLLETRLTRLRDPKLAQNPAFLRIFSPLCNRLHVYLRKPIDLAAKIDALEAIPEITEGLSYPRMPPVLSCGFPRSIASSMPTRMN